MPDNKDSSACQVNYENQVLISNTIETPNFFSLSAGFTLPPPFDGNDDDGRGGGGGGHYKIKPVVQ